MIPIEEFRKTLGEAATGKSDEEIAILRDAMWELCEIIYETKILPGMKKKRE